MRLTDMEKLSAAELNATMYKNVGWNFNNLTTLTSRDAAKMLESVNTKINTIKKSRLHESERDSSFSGLLLARRVLEAHLEESMKPGNTSKPKKPKPGGKLTLGKGKGSGKTKKKVTEAIDPKSFVNKLRENGWLVYISKTNHIQEGAYNLEFEKRGVEFSIVGKGNQWELFKNGPTMSGRGEQFSSLDSAFKGALTEGRQQVKEDWGSSDWTPIMNAMNDAVEKYGASPEVIQDTAAQEAEFYYEDMGYDSPEDAADQIVRIWLIRRGWIKRDGSHLFSEGKKKVGEANMRMNEFAAKHSKKMKIKESQKRSRRMVREDSISDAESIMAAQDMVDRIQKTLEDVSSMVNEEMPPLLDSIRGSLGADKSDAFKTTATDALNSLMDAARTARETMDGAVRGLSGEAPMSSAPMPGAEGGDDMMSDITTDDDMDMPELDGGDDGFDTSDAAAGGEEMPLGRGTRV